MRIGAIIIAILVLFSTHGYTETKRELNVGDHLRIQMTGSSGKYVLDRIRQDTLFVHREHDNEFQQMAFEQIERIEVRVPRSSGFGALRGAAIGGAIGGAIGALYALATWDDVNTNCGYLDEICSNTASGLRFIGSVAVFGIPGLVLGAVIGAAAPGENWQQIELTETMTIGIDANRTLFLQYSRTF